MDRAIIVITVLVVSVLVSCSKEATIAGASSGENCIDYNFIFKGTKSGDASSTTYRAMLFSVGGNPGVYPYINYSVPSGTYREPVDDEKEWLVACQTDPITGVWLSDTHQYGLRANRDKYYLSFVSPAVEPVPYKWDAITGRVSEWGFFHNRELQTSDPELFICTPILIDSLKGNHLKNQCIYDVPDNVVLKERRAKVKIQLRCGDDLVSAKVKKVGWSNYYESCYYNLRLDTLDTFTLSSPTDTVFVYEPELGTEMTLLRGDDPVELDETFSIFPLKYSQKDSDGMYIYATPEINVYVSQGVAKLQLLQNLMSQYEYTYLITINSAYVSVYVTAAPWNNLGGSSTSVNQEPSYLTSFTYSWNNYTPAGGVI